VRILFVAWKDLAHPKAGGSEVVVDVLARSLMARGHEVSLLCSAPVGARPYEVVPNGGMYTQYLRAPFEYARRFRDADLVVDVANGMLFYSPLWRRGPRLCLVHHVHAEQWDRYFPRPVAAAFQVVEARSLPLVYRRTHFIADSDSTVHDLLDLGVEPAHVHLMNLGVDVIEPDGPVARSETPMFLTLGRLAPNKRLDLLLDHWAQVGPQTGGTLVIAGDGPERDHLAARVAAEPALRGVVLEGRVTEARKAELLRQAWLMVHPAEREGWGLTIIEAAQGGTPSLGYRVAGVKDAVVDGTTGVLVDTDEEFVKEWIALSQQSDRRAELGRAAAVRAREFTWERTVDDFLVAADAAIAESRNGRAVATEAS
jgi:glycosyltransferase involved in cell wall biosynthesis